MLQKGIFIVAALLCACGSTSLTPNGPAQEPRNSNCDFEVFTTAPNSGFIEIGTIDVTSGLYGHNVFTKIDEFKREIGPHVCLAGGDAAIVHVNGFGMYIKATVIKRVEQPASAPFSSNTGTPAAEAGGCRYDTQCKGDRICVKGACVDPGKPDTGAPASPAR